MYRMDKDIENRIADLCIDFENCLAEEPPFGDWAWHIHRETIKMRKQFVNVSEAIDSYDFVVHHLGYTLVAWGMDGQAAELVPRSEFFQRIKKRKCLLLALEKYSNTNLTDPKLITILWQTIHALELSETYSQVVTGAKTLHHLLPGLLPPIDRRYTSKFFTPSRLKVTRDPNARSHFSDIVRGFGIIARLLEEAYCKDYLTSLVDKTTWATSETKLIDNAIIGYVKRHNL